MKLTRSWVGKKSPTNPEKKESHLSRKKKRIILTHIKDNEHELELMEFKKNANQPIQK